jgi:hypothetical protein
MKHLTYSEKSLLVSDEAADLVLEYASALSNRGESDTVQIVAFGADGDEVTATLLLGQGAPLMAESVTTSMSEPDNSDMVGYVRGRLETFASPPQAQPDSGYSERHLDDDYQLG